MKTKVLLFSTLFFSAHLFTYAADEDITPGHLKFADKAAGPYEFVHYSSTGANPTSPYPAENLKEDGTVVLTGGQVKDETGVAILNKGCHIVASEYGNMLLIKGNGSTEQPDLSAADALGGYANIHMFTQTDFPINTPVRFHFVSQVIGDPVTADYKISIWNYGGAVTNVPLPETTTYTAVDTKWWPIYADLDIAGITGSDRIPLRIRFNIPGGHLANRAIYIAKIQFTANPTGECPEFNPITFDGWDTPDGSTPSGIDAIGNDAKGFVTWDNQYIYLNNMDIDSVVSIYSLNGALVKTVSVTDSFMEVPMSRGAYIVKYANKTSKVIL